MNVQIKYFASIREALGCAEESFDTSAQTLDELRQALIARGDPYAQVLAPGKAVRMAVNQVLAHAQVTLTPGCEVAFFPPVTGG